MPVRVVCPSCGTQLNVRDEHAGRSVKCPKCSYVIPPAQAQAPVAPPGAELPEPAASAAPPPLPGSASAPPPLPPTPMSPPRPKPPSPDDSPASRPTARPADARPPRNRDEDDGEDRPKRRPRRRDEDDDDIDDRPRNRPAKQKSNTPIILLVVGGILLTCCGGVGYGIYYAVQKVKEVAEQARQRLENTNLLVSQLSYEQLKLNMTRAEVERNLGVGREATLEDVEKAFRPGSFKIKEWEPRAKEGRVLVWRNGEDYILACFYPNALPTAKLQAKAWEPESRTPTAIAGSPDDKKYLELYKDRTVGPALEGPATPVTAEQLAKEYKADVAKADAKYKDKVLLVDGPLSDILVNPLEVTVLLEGLPPTKENQLGNSIMCNFKTANASDVWKLSRGQKVKIRGKLLGSSGTFTTLTDCTLDSQEADPSMQAQASVFFNEFAKDAKAADEKYKDKQITLLSAVVESKEDAALVLVGPSKKGPALKVKATWPFDSRKQLDNLKVGSRVTVKGEYGGFSDGVISLNRCWLVP